MQNCLMEKIVFTAAFIFITVLSYSQNDIIKLKDKTSLAAEKIESKAIEWRRKLHEHPELGNREFNTAKLIAAHLKSLGIEVKEGVPKTGVVGILKGGNPGPCMGLRADMDALPIVEKVNLPFASKE